MKTLTQGTIRPKESRTRRRSFLRDISGIAGLLALPIPSLGEAAQSAGGPDARVQAAFSIRQSAAMLDSRQNPAPQITNGDEQIPGYIACYTKGLPHNEHGEVDPTAYKTLLQAVNSGLHSDFENITRGSGMKLVNPESAFTFELEGADSHCLACPPPPSFSSAEAAAEMVELYWHAQARDVPFSDYAQSPVIASACKELTALSKYQGPRQADGTVTPANIFRVNAPGCLDGPYISQFFLKSVPVNSTWVEQRYRAPVAAIDYLNNYPEWDVLQSGLPPYRDPAFDPTPSYISNGRRLAEWVHYDFLYQAFHNAALILLNLAPETILDRNPYWAESNPYKHSLVQTGFATFGAPHICSWLGRVSTAALQAAWFQKWCVHRRIRPEEFGGRVHQALSGAASYPISPDLLHSAAVSATFKVNGNYLLPQAFPEGCPLHPAYPSGHATVSGACSALLKAFFDETALVTACVSPAADGASVAPLEDVPLTVGGEVNKLAMNIAIGRNFAGIHYRSDAMAGFRLGENVAIAMMQDLIGTITEEFDGFQFTRMDGTPVNITKQALVNNRTCFSGWYRPLAGH